MSATQPDDAVPLRHFAPSFEMSWNQFVAAVLLAFPADLTVVNISRGPENLDALIEFVTADEYSVSVRVGWNGRDATAVEIDSTGTELAPMLLMPCTRKTELQATLSTLLSEFSEGWRDAGVDPDSLRLSADEIADERAVSLARSSRFAGATSWPASPAPDWLSVGGHVELPDFDDFDTGAGSNRGTVTRIEADQGLVVVETDDGRLEHWPMARIAEASDQ